NSAVVGLAGILVGTTIRENAFLGPVGIGNVPEKQAVGAVLAAQAAPLLTLSLDVQDNALLCSQRGISFAGVSVHVLDTRLSGNFINDCAQGGIVALGFVPTGSRLETDGNELRTGGSGIIIGTGGARISANSISGINQRVSGDG